MSNELKPCPFCGSKIVLILRDKEAIVERYRAICSYCSAQIYRGTKLKTAEAWNRRANDG